MKSIVAICVLFALVGFAAAGSTNFDGQWLDNRFGGHAWICSEDNSAASDEVFNNQLQGHASSKIFFFSDDYSWDDKYINGKYWEAGPIPRAGSFTLKCVAQNSFGCQRLAGWYYPKDDPVGSGWPWVLTRTNFNAPEQDPDSLQCLYRNNATDVPEVNGQWDGLLGGITICNNREGVLTFSQGGSDAYVSGKSRDHKHIITGRYYRGAFPADDKVKKDQFCDDIDGVNIMLKVFSLPDQSFNLGGFISSGNIFNPQNSYKVVYANLSEEDDEECASANFADRLAECETGEVGGPIFNPFRASAASMAVSVAAVVFVVVATLF